MLDGVTVVEMGTHLTVPFCGRLLRGLGAHVVKVEPPGGDPLRHAGSPAAAALFAHLNAGKESVLLDADAWACPRPLEPLLRRAQIWLDGRPAATINADPVAAAVRRSPAASGLVHVAVTPFGLDGPWADRKGTGLVAAAMGGFMHLCGDPTREPLRNGASLPEFQAGLFAALGAVAGLLALEAGLGGSAVDVSLLESVIAFQERGDLAVTHLDQDWVRSRRHEVGHPFTVYPCADGFVTLAVGTPRHWANLCTLIGKPEWAEDTELVLNRLARADMIDAVLVPWLLARPSAEVVRACQELFIPCGPVLSADQVLADAHLAERRFFQTLPRDGADPVLVPGAPFRWSGGTWPEPAPAPQAGEHTAVYTGGGPCASVS